MAQALHHFRTNRDRCFAIVEREPGTQAMLHKINPPSADRE
jgi:hypothetical protein